MLIENTDRWAGGPFRQYATVKLEQLWGNINIPVNQKSFPATLMIKSKHKAAPCIIRPPPHLSYQPADLWPGTSSAEAVGQWAGGV